MTVRCSIRRGFGFLLACVAAVTGVGDAAGPASAGTLGYRSGVAVPAAWKRYAELVQFRFVEWMSGDAEAAYRFHLFMENRVIDSAEPPAALTVKTWIGDDGIVRRIDFPSLGDAQAEEDLREVLVGQDIGEAPPADMLQPLYLRLSLQWRS